MDIVEACTLFGISAADLANRKVMSFRRCDAVLLGSTEMASMLYVIAFELHAESSFYFVDPDGGEWLLISLQEWMLMFPWISQRTIKNHLRKLKESGLVEIVRTRVYNGANGANLHRLARGLKC